MSRHMCLSLHITISERKSSYSFTRPFMSVLKRLSEDNFNILLAFSANVWDLEPVYGFCWFRILGVQQIKWNVIVRYAQTFVFKFTYHNQWSKVQLFLHKTIHVGIETL